MPPGLCALFVTVIIIKDGKGCGRTLYGVLMSLLYPLWVPARSIYLTVKELFWGKDKEEELNIMKGLKMFEQLGQYFLFMLQYFINKSSDIQERPAHS